MESKNKFLLCPNKECKKIPEITYIYSHLNPIVKYKCNLHNKEKEIEIELSKFLDISSHKIICDFCKKEINNLNDFFFCSNCEAFFDNLCNFKHNYSNKSHNVLPLNNIIIFNNCLKHNNTFIFRCTNCHESLCAKCDLNSHNFDGHELKQLFNFNFSNTQNEYDRIIFDFEKQKYYLKIIKEINNDIIKNLENDIIIKEKIIDNYKNNKYNFQSIQNFSGLKVKNNEKYENLLKNIIEQYNENKNNQIPNNNDSLINQILSPIYYSMMINLNQNDNNELFNNLKIKFKDLDNLNNIKNNINNEQKNEKEIVIEIKKGNNNIIEKDYPHKELRTIEEEGPINNMILLKSGNIALSMMGIIHIYDTRKLSLSSKKKSLIQKIEISKKNMVKYIYEFPNETLLCSIYSKIYRIKLTENEASFSILGFIKLGENDLPKKIISLGNLFLLVLSETNEISNLKLFIKKKYLGNKILIFKYDKDDDNNDKDNYSDNSNEPEKKNYYLNDMKRQDKELILCNKSKNLNLSKINLNSIFEITKNNNINENEFSYEFITTSNSDYKSGDNRVEFYEVKKSKNNIIFEKNKLLSNICCSREVNSICQLNDKFICIVIQNSQISGYAIINVKEKEISQIIQDNKIYYLNFIKENNLLMAVTEDRNKDDVYKIIKMYNIIENEENLIDFKKLCEFKSNHKDKIISLIEIKSMNYTSNEQNIDDCVKLNKKNIICASASKDKTLRIVETKIENKIS